MQPGPKAKEEAGIRVETPRADWTRQVGALGPRGWAVTSDLWAGRHCSLGRMHAGPSHSHTHRDMHTDTRAHTHVHAYILERKPGRKKNPGYGIPSNQDGTACSATIPTGRGPVREAIRSKSSITWAFQREYHLGWSPDLTGSEVAGLHENVLSAVTADRKHLET